MAALTLDEARTRAALIDVTSCAVELDLDRGSETFASTTRLRFACTMPGAETFVDLKAREVHSLELNGAPLDTAAWVDGRLALSDLAAENELVVTATMAFSRDGQGLHRSVDPEDGKEYVYGHLFLDAAPRVFACFDQPDLKTPYDVAVKAPVDWIVVGNGAAARDEERGAGWWRLATTKPLATYFVTVCAGPYASVLGEHDGIPLGVHVRASQAERLAAQAPEILAITAAGFDFYHALFGIRYPFGAYHQVFAPEFNAGAMENPGCVVLRDQMIFPGAASDAERMGRANTVLHEMAHMWFGDLVTMRWWDDLWLNESFAEFMAHRACLEATEFTQAWADFTMLRKSWGYAAERSPSTHPVAGNPPQDAPAALQNFDGISYAKGASVLAQLIAYIGRDAFDAGVRAHLADHAYGNATLADFLAVMGAAAGRDLDAWAAAWLRTAGLDTLTVDLRGADTVTSAAITRREPVGHPDRPHALAVAGYAGGVELWRVPVVVDRAEKPLPDVVGRPMPAVVVPDPGSATWATVRLSERTLAALPRELSRIPDPVARAVVWTALGDGLADAVVDPRAVVDIIGAAWPAERGVLLLHGVQTVLVPKLLRRFLAPADVPAAREALADAAARLAAAVEPGSSAALIAARGRVAWCRDEAYLRGVAGGDVAVDAFAAEPELRWSAATTLARLGAIGRAELDDMAQRDRSFTGKLDHLTARAALPGEKAWAWAELTGADGGTLRSNYELNALAQGFWLTDDAAALRPYAERYVTDIPALAGRLGEDALARVARFAFPSVLVEEPVAELARDALRRDDLSAAVRREIVDSLAALEQALASRARYA